jgi:pantoate ligase/cytidylate kinase
MVDLGDRSSGGYLMRLVQSIATLRDNLSAFKEKSVGLVPTMGALHKGHLSLIDHCRQHSEVTVVSIFVNPLQFGPQEDFARYPRTLASDCQLCQAAGVDLVFAPPASEILNADRSAAANSASAGVARTLVTPPAELLQHLCAPFRPGHFAGVTTIVLQLFNLVQPQQAYFGEKDAQQLILIQTMVQDLHYPVAIVPCPIVREVDGLALSSRNQYLSPSERQVAAGIYQSLLKGKECFAQGDRSAKAILAAVTAELAHYPEIRLQYLELVDLHRLQPIDTITDCALLAIGAFVGVTRLIDNMRLQVPAEALSEQSIRTPRRKILIAIDGPAGAGKSTVARQVAAELGLLYLDTGAMYRAITWRALQEGIAPQEEEKLTHLAATVDLRLETGHHPAEPTRVWVNGHEVTQEIRSQRVTQLVSAVAAVAGVRREMVRQQRFIGQAGGVVLEGRDIGTYVFPDADLKIFLTASVEERARRRLLDLSDTGQDVDLDDLTQQIEARDRYDSERLMAPLQQASDAIVIHTDDLTQAEVQARIMELYRQLS